jgi:isopentenyl diphosphate isomerase/L-lactate dehydrogenase-like FMN-dependent dehydrogenase
MTHSDAGGLNRRDLLKAPAFLGGGGMVAQAMAPAIASAQAPAAPGRLDPKDVLAKARERLYPTCRVCPVCNGVACSGDGGGIAGAGSGMSFQNNFTALQRVKVLMRNVHEIRKVDPSTSIFGRRISFPAVAAPMGPAATKFGKGMTQQEWFEALIAGCVAAGTLGSVGDDLRYPEADVKRNLSAIQQHKGQALYNSKPVANAILLNWLPSIEASGAAWLSIDVDSGPKSVAELRELVKAFKIPIVIKGIMTVDDALRCMDAGVAGIAVSNHGGRRQDHAAGTAEVLPAIAARVKGKIPILADGCVSSGTDVLKYLALGADVVMVGRHILRAAYGAGPEGVALFMNRMRAEFESAMLLTGVPTVSKIDGSILYKQQG